METDYVKLFIFPIIVEAESLFSCDMETKYNFATAGVTFYQISIVPLFA